MDPSNEQRPHSGIDLGVPARQAVPKPKGLAGFAVHRPRWAHPRVPTGRGIALSPAGDL
jgi:hypothetical protein